MRFSEEEIIGLKREKLLLILDGYDEIRKTQNIFKLSQLDQWDAKVIITCRSQYLFGNYKAWFQPSSGKMMEIRFIPFTM